MTLLRNEISIMGELYIYQLWNILFFLDATEL